MFDLFGKKHKKALFDRANGEFHSGNYDLTINLLTELIKSGSSDFNAYNLRALCYGKKGDFVNAFNDSKISINLEPNIKLNEGGYAGRNSIMELLKSEKIKVDVFELTYYFDVQNTIKLIDESSFGGFEIFRIHFDRLFYNNMERRLRYVALEFVKQRTLENHSNSEKRSSFLREIDRYIAANVSDLHIKLSQAKTFLEIPEIGSLTESANNYFRSFLFDETVFDYIRLEDYQSKMGNDLESFESIPNELKLHIEEIKIKNTCIEYYLEYLDQFYFRPFQVD